MKSRFAQPAAVCLAAAVLAAAPALTAVPLDERIADANPVHHWTFPLSDVLTVGKVREIDGPSPRLFPAFSPDARAAQFAPGSYLRLPHTGTDPAYQFANGDTITLEAWVRCEQIDPGQNQYIIGKGRTHREGFDQDNQNWALRLRGKGRQAKLSFLFHSQSEKGAPGAYHRWTSKRGFGPGKRWHHLAVTYEFGRPESLRAWVDGKPTNGSWDLGDATTRPPVVDHDEVWIGSALGGEPATSLRGAIASIALYRHPVDGFEEAYEAVPRKYAFDPRVIPGGRVLIESFQSDSGSREWPFELDDPVRSLDAPAFALFRMPLVYDRNGVRAPQKGVHLIRLAAMIQFPPGEHEFLLRAPGMTRLSIGNEVAVLGPATTKGDAHGPLRNRPALPYPQNRLGTEETKGRFRSTGERQLVMIEALVGHDIGKHQVGEILLASRPLDSPSWSLVSPGESVPFTADALERYRLTERDQHDTLNTAARRRRAAESDPYWKSRHARATDYIASLPLLEIPDGFAGNAVDRFLHAKIASAKAGAPASDSPFLETVHPLLEEHCFRCHGRKTKGGLRLDSRPAALQGGDSGPALDLQNPPNSELLRRIRSHDQDERMPPKGERLDDHAIAALTRWIESGAPWEEAGKNVTIPPSLDDHAFLRRLYLDTVGVFPTPAEVSEYLADSSSDKRARLVDRLLADPRHADHWVSYWQDVLAENPRLVKPTLNNTGPFRWYLHEALLDNKPFDRFVTELVTFAGGSYSGGAAGFKLATQNDVPMAAKAHIIGTAFLGLELQCARCHDAPFHSLKQEDLFSLAAMLKGAPLEVPATSSVPAEFFEGLGERKSRIKVTLDPDTPVQPAWPFAKLAPVRDSDPSFATPAEHLAYQITRPENHRFARVAVNRIWKRYFGQGFVEPAGDWEDNDPSHPELLDFLARELVSNNYDLRHLSRLILNSETYRRAPRSKPAATASSRFFEAPLRRRLSAEQLVDSLFAATGVPFFSEELTLDVEGWRPNKDFLNMGQPRRAWEFVSLSTERDRPSLTLPNAQAIVSFMEAYGWRSNRAEPLTDRNTDPDVLQAGLLANGLLGTWWTRLSDYSDLTRLAVEADSAEALIDALYLRLLTRKPAATERKSLLELIAPEFDSRLGAPAGQFRKKLHVPPVRHISWRNHLNPEANQLAAEIEDRALQGPPPSDFLTPGWRERFEDVIWSLVNSPEMQFTP